MMYFWLVPVLILVAVSVWLLYAAATKRGVSAGRRTSGETLVDKDSGENRRTGESG